MANKEVKINGKKVLCKDVMEIKQVYVSDQHLCEITYNDSEEPIQLKVLVPFKEGYEIEKKVRKVMCK